MRGTTLIVTVSLLLAGTLAPGAAAEPDPPECYDRQPIVDAGVVSVWLTRSCSVRVDVDEDAVPEPNVPPVPHTDVYLPPKAPSPDPCPVLFSGEYVRSVDTAVVDVYVWTCTFDSGPPP